MPVSAIVNHRGDLNSHWIFTLPWQENYSGAECQSDGICVWLFFRCVEIKTLVICILLMFKILLPAKAFSSVLAVWEEAKDIANQIGWRGTQIDAHAHLPASGKHGCQPTSLPACAANDWIVSSSRASAAHYFQISLGPSGAGALLLPRRSRSEDPICRGRHAAPWSCVQFKAEGC